MISPSPVLRTRNALTGVVIAVVSLCALALVLSNATTAIALEPKTEVKSVPAEIVFEKANEPGDPGHCAAIVFVKWQDVPYTLSSTVHYTYKGEEKTSVATKPPFDDSYSFVANFTVPYGSHWISVAQSWGDGPVANDCGAAQIKQQERYTQPARADLTVEVQEPVVTTDPKACEDANANLKKRNKAVSKLLGKLRKAPGDKAKERIRTKLKKARRDRAKAVQQVAKDC